MDIVARFGEFFIRHLNEHLLVTLLMVSMIANMVFVREIRNILVREVDFITALNQRLEERINEKIAGESRMLEQVSAVLAMLKEYQQEYQRNPPSGNGA